MDPVEHHYSRSSILDAIRNGFAELGKNVDELTTADLAPVDEFHVRGREATIELAKRAGFAPGMKLLDAGCGVGGSARHLAEVHGATVHGIDLTPDFVEVATQLSRWVGLEDKTVFAVANALDLPFGDNEFDGAWTEHVQMNIADKAQFYSEIGRVVKPGGKFAFHDIFAGVGEVQFPVPWADGPAISFLATPQEAFDHVRAAGFEIIENEDVTALSAAWFKAAIEKALIGPKMPLGLHLLMGPTAREKLGNVARNLSEGRIRTVQAIAVKF